MTTIKLKSGSGAPLASDLIAGEPALDLINKRLYTEDLGGNVIEVGTNPTSLTTGTFTSTGIDDNATSTAITIDSSQNVGIGTQSPTFTTGSGLEIQRTSATATLRLEYTGANGYELSAESGQVTYNSVSSLPHVFEIGSSEKMRIASNGNVGIGTDSPSTDLDVRNNISMGDGTSVTQLSMIRNSANYIAATNASGYLVFRTGGTNERMRIDSSGNVGIGTQSPSVPLEVNGIARVNSYLSLNNNGYIRGDAVGELRFQSGATATTFYDSTNITERMRIDSSGNVGIGTAAPSAKLHVTSPTNARALKLQNVGAASASYAIFVSDDGTEDAYIGNEPSQVAQDTLVFGTGGTERMRIGSSGNLLVGTTSTPTSATSQVFADNTKRYYFATKQIASGSTTSFFKVTIPGTSTRQVLDFELETASTSPSHGSSSMTSGQIILTRGKFDTNVRITTVINGTATTGAGGFVALTSSGSGNDATFTLQLQSYVPAHDQTCNIHIYSRTTNLTVAAV